jgi:hypothetical protein
MALTVRFNTSGRIDARNGGAYTAASAITYTAGTSYRFRLVVNVAAHSYSAYVTPAGGTELTIGTNLAFRSEQSAVPSLANLAVQANSGTHQVCNFAITNSLPPPPVASVTVTPSTANVEVGGNLQLTATPRDASGNALNGRAVTWSSGNTARATVNTTGLVMGVTEGSVTITATSEGRSGTATVTVVPPPPPGSSFTFVGAGDIGNCSTSTDEATAQLLDGIAGTVWTAGDNVYPDGAAAEFAQCYDPNWGRHKARTRPSPGNHDYHTSGASAYYAYFGANAGPAGRGYYSFDLGEWHIISLNSEASMSTGSAQDQWLRADLAASTKQCTIAIWHHPRFSSGDHGNDAQSAGAWVALYEAGVEIILNGHDHNYERFAPQTPGAVRDDARGIREFVVGTGGTSLRSVGTPVANSEVASSAAHGVLKLTLAPGRYDWQFVPVAGRTFTDQGTGTCH